MSEILEINRSWVLYERFGDEVVAINNSNGQYYSLNGVSAKIWAILEAGATLPQLLLHVASRYSGDGETIEKSVREFVGQLLEQELVVSVETTAEPDNNVVADGAAPIPFQEPQLEIYSDMQDLLLLDPIHEVDETGWPSKPAESKTA